MASPNQLAANRANSQLSTGPTSSQGKARVSSAQGDLQPVVRASRLAALKTGLTGRTVLLPSDDVTAYQAHVDRIFKQFSPEGLEQQQLVKGAIKQGRYYEFKNKGWLQLPGKAA